MRDFLFVLCSYLFIILINYISLANQSKIATINSHNANNNNHNYNSYNNYNNKRKLQSEKSAATIDSSIDLSETANHYHGDYPDGQAEKYTHGNYYHYHPQNNYHLSSQAHPDKRHHKRHWYEFEQHEKGKEISVNHKNFDKQDGGKKNEQTSLQHWNKKYTNEHKNDNFGHHTLVDDKHKMRKEKKKIGDKEDWHHDKSGGHERQWHWDKGYGTKRHWHHKGGDWNEDHHKGEKKQWNEEEHGIKHIGDTGKNGNLEKWHDRYHKQKYENAGLKDIGQKHSLEHKNSKNHHHYHHQRHNPSQKHSVYHANKNPDTKLSKQYDEQVDHIDHYNEDGNNGHDINNAYDNTQDAYDEHYDDHRDNGKSDYKS